MLQFIEGNLLQAPEQYVTHQCNVVSRKAAHLAYDMFKAFPYANVYAERDNTLYYDLFYANGVPPDKPGTIKIRGDGKEQRFVINMFGQFYPGKPQLMNAKLDSPELREKYFYNCLVEISNIPDLQSIAFPHAIGCGAANGNWDKYFDMLERFAKYVFDKKETKTVIYKLP
jgi:hypothetical protein